MKNWILEYDTNRKYAYNNEDTTNSDLDAKLKMTKRAQLNRHFKDDRLKYSSEFHGYGQCCQLSVLEAWKEMDITRWLICWPYIESLKY